MAFAEGIKWIIILRESIEEDGGCIILEFKYRKDSTICPKIEVPLLQGPIIG